MLKIISGDFKGRKLEVPQNFVRPTSALKREAIFSIIESFAIKNSIELYNNKTVIDLFAGTGAIGLEAISRGMSKAFFYENNRKVIKILKKNCLKICSRAKFEIIEQDIMNSTLDLYKNKISLIFIDPPYEKYNISLVIEKILSSNLTNSETLIVIEESNKIKLTVPNKLILIKKKNYNRTSLYFLKCI